jgi:long-chain acyl-CoA synthetase
MNPLLKMREVAYYLGESGAGLIFAWDALSGEARSGAELTHGNLISNTEVARADIVRAGAHA